MTFEEMVDGAVLNLLLQGVKSANVNNSCKYRTSDGLKCVVGWMIPDECYIEDMDDPVKTLVGIGGNDIVQGALAGVCGELSRDQLRVLAQLQDVHDRADRLLFVDNIMWGFSSLYGECGWGDRYAVIEEKYRLAKEANE